MTNWMKVSDVWEMLDELDERFGNEQDAHMVHLGTVPDLCADTMAAVDLANVESLQAKHTGLLKWAEGAKLDNEGLKSRIGEIESALRIQAAATGYWKDHWDQAYSEQHGQPPQEPKDD